MTSTRQCLLNQFADLSVCANQYDFHQNSILACLGLAVSFDYFVTLIVCQLTNSFDAQSMRLSQAWPCGPAVSGRLAFLQASN
jgi:hypothetical protein